MYFSYEQTGRTYHGSETAKWALREKDEGILIDGRKKPKSTKKDKDSLKKEEKKQTWYECKYSKMLLGIRYNERENKNVTLGPNKESVSP